MSVSIFFCYAHEDEDLLNKLKRHPWPLQRQGLIAVWHDRDISAGSEWEQEISQHLNAAQIILLLVSPDFIYSEYCYGIEMKRAIERHERKEAKVIPIILRPVHWQGVLGKLQALPKDGLPITDPDWNNLDRAFYNVTEGIRTVVEQLEEMRLAEQVRLAAQERQAEEQKARLAEEAERLRRAEEEQLRLAEERQRKVHVGTQSVPTPQPFRESHSPVKPLPSVKPEALSLLPALTVHTRGVTSVAFRPDGQTVASAVGMGP